MSPRKGHELSRSRSALLVAVLLSTLLAGVSLVLTHGRMPIDLAVYRRGGDSVLSGGDSVYDTVTGDLPFTYPPVAATVFVVLAVLPGVVAAGLVAWASFFSLAHMLRLTIAHLRLPPGARGWRPWLWVPAVLAGCVLEPVSWTIYFGQVNLILAGLVATDLLGARRRWSGVLLGLAISVKLTPAVFLLVPLVRRDLSFLVRAAVTVVACAVLPLLWMPDSTRQFWTEVVADSSRVGGVQYVSNQSLTGALWRFAGEGGAPVVWAATSALLVAVIVWACHRHRDGQVLEMTLLCAFLALLISPISWIHHWVWVLPTTAWLVATATSAGTSTVKSTATGAATATHRPTRRHGAGVPLALALGWLALTASRVVWLTPHENGAEYAASVPAKLVAIGYTLLGVATVALLLVHLRRTRPRTGLAEQGEHSGAVRPHG